MRAECVPNRDGQVADYIPELTIADPDPFGIAVANLGRNPFTDVPVFDLSAFRDTLSVMLTCGMCDYSGNWVLDVDVPCKSGVGGGIMGAVNRQIGIGSFSPRLDAKGNSVRGLHAFKQLADEFGLHVFECMNIGSQILRVLSDPAPMTFLKCMRPPKGQ